MRRSDGWMVELGDRSICVGCTRMPVEVESPQAEEGKTVTQGHRDESCQHLMMVVAVGRVPTESSTRMELDFSRSRSKRRRMLVIRSGSQRTVKQMFAG